MNLHIDDEHRGRWKQGDPDVVMLGDEYVESSEEYTSNEDSDISEVPESESGEE